MASLNSVSADTVEVLADELTSYQQVLNEIPYMLERFAVKFVIALIIFFVGLKLIGIFRKIIKKAFIRGKVETGVTQFIDSLIKFALISILVIIIASFFGLETTSLIALLSSAGVTLALALQGSLSNLTGGVLIMLLKPFKVGDYIIEDTNKNEGTVEEIQMFFTKLRTLDDKTVFLPNGTLANASLTNVNITPVRRVCFIVPISYDSDIKTAKSVIKNSLLKVDNILKDRAIDIYVDELAGSSVNMGVRFYVNNEHFFNAKCQALEKVKIALDEAGIVIPFNQLDVHIAPDRE